MKNDPDLSENKSKINKNKTDKILNLIVHLVEIDKQCKNEIANHKIRLKILVRKLETF